MSPAASVWNAKGRLTALDAGTRRGRGEDLAAGRRRREGGRQAVSPLPERYRGSKPPNSNCSDPKRHATPSLARCPLRRGGPAAEDPNLPLGAPGSGLPGVAAAGERLLSPRVPWLPASGSAAPWAQPRGSRHAVVTGVQPLRSPWLATPGGHTKVTEEV